MSIIPLPIPNPIRHNGLYRFRNAQYPGTGSGRVLNAYGTTSLANGRNVMLYTNDPNDKAQQWRAMYAGIDKSSNRTLYWLNCELGGRKYPYALDRLTISPENNADVYQSCDRTVKAWDQLVYFTDNGLGLIRIHLYKDNYILTAASDANGGNNPSGLTAPGNCYWTPDELSNGSQLWIIEILNSGEAPTEKDRATEFPTNCYYDEKNNNIYPDHVGECTWYCNGRADCRTATKTTKPIIEPFLNNKQPLAERKSARGCYFL